jgi:hypothetical protein
MARNPWMKQALHRVGRAGCERQQGTSVDHRSVIGTSVLRKAKIGRRINGCAGAIRSLLA